MVRDTTIAAVVSSGLAQQVRISSVAPCPGENITIHSELTITAPDSLAVTARTCGLDLAGTLSVALPPDVAVCLGYVMGGTFASGTVLSSTAIQRVYSGPGSYTLRIRHAVAPELWITVPITVRRE